MRILHTSDWHIGRQLHGVSLLEDQAYVLDQILAIASDEAVDVVVIAGDIYDRAVPPAEAVTLLDRTLTHLTAALKLPVVVISGNHDSRERLSFGSTMMGGAGLHLAGTLNPCIEPLTLQAGSLEVDFFCLPYADPAAVRHVLGPHLQDQPCATHEEAMAHLTVQVAERRVAGRPCVVVAHCFIDGGEVSDSERPLSVGGADRINADLFSPFDYVALGHLHRAQYKGAEHIRYSGSILKYSFSEATHRKSVTLVDLDASGVTAIKEVPLRPKRDLRVLEGRLEDILTAGATDPASDDYVMARLSDTHAILDIIGKLRDVYPNTLHLERPGLAPSGNAPAAAREMLRRSELDLFRSFFAEMQGEAPSAAQEAVVTQILDGLRRTGEEA